MSEKIQSKMEMKLSSSVDEWWKVIKANKTVQLYSTMNVLSWLFHLLDCKHQLANKAIQGWGYHDDSTRFSILSPRLFDVLHVISPQRLQLGGGVGHVLLYVIFASQTELQTPRSVWLQCKVFCSKPTILFLRMSMRGFQMRELLARWSGKTVM